MQDQPSSLRDLVLYVYPGHPNPDAEVANLLASGECWVYEDQRGHLIFSDHSLHLDQPNKTLTFVGSFTNNIEITGLSWGLY